MRIVSLLPSATEIVCLLGLDQQLVGVTHECDYPAHVVDLPKVTKTLISHDAPSHDVDLLVRERLAARNALYALDMPMLARLEPDLIVTQALCDVCAVAEEEVQAAAYSLLRPPRVVNLEPMSIGDVYDCIQLVGDAAGKAQDAAEAISALRRRARDVARRCERLVHRPRVMLLEWIDPPFCSGHWTPELVRLAGGREVIGVEGQPSRTTPWNEILQADPQVLVIACCGFSVERTLADLPILRSYPGWATLSCVRSGRVFVVDGSAYFSRPGPRLIDSLEILAQILHPDVHPRRPDLPKAIRVQA
jgi:iron complex transport system substrate-binding protein